MSLSCMKIFQWKGRTRVSSYCSLDVRGKRTCSVPDPYDGNGLLVAPWSSKATGNSDKQQAGKGEAEAVNNDIILISEVKIAQRLAGQVCSPDAFL